ncbi:hypothetical protein CDIK_1773 [Cucumispora dikerogammari]|nr:hypothetical protein CDIK_1773 [Cucumispora dikerogammari]
MSDSTYTHFLFLIFLIILSLKIIFTSPKTQSVCKCVECEEAVLVINCKNAVNTNNKESQKNAISSTSIINNNNLMNNKARIWLSNRKLLLITFPLIIFSLFNITLKLDTFLNTTPTSFTILGVDIDATLSEIEGAHRHKLISIVKLRGSEEYLEKQKKFSDAYNALKLNIKSPKFRADISDLSVIKEVPNSYMIIIVYIFVIVYILRFAFRHMNNRNDRNKFGVSYDVVRRVIEKGILEDNLNVWKTEGAYGVIGGIIKECILSNYMSSLTGPQGYSTRFFLYFSKLKGKLKVCLSKLIWAIKPPSSNKARECLNHKNKSSVTTSPHIIFSEQDAINMETTETVTQAQESIESNKTEASTDLTIVDILEASEKGSPTNNNITIINKILKESTLKLETTLPYKIPQLNFITLVIYIQCFRLNILNEVLNLLVTTGEISNNDKKYIIEVKDIILFTAFQVLPCLKKICASKQILYMLFRTHTDLLRGTEFSRKVATSEPSGFISDLRSTASNNKFSRKAAKNSKAQTYKYTDKDSLFSPPLTVYFNPGVTNSTGDSKTPYTPGNKDNKERFRSGLSDNLSTPKFEKGLSFKAVLLERETIIKLKFNADNFQKGFLQKGTYKENGTLVHDPFLQPIKYDGVFSELCGDDALYLSRVEQPSSVTYKDGEKDVVGLSGLLLATEKYWMPKKSYTLFLHTDNEVVAVESFVDFIGDKDVFFERRAKGCLLYSDDTGMAIEIK